MAANRAEALADILAAARGDVLGQQILVNGLPVSAVKRILPQDEAVDWSENGLRVEVVRVVCSRADLGFTPRERNQLTIDGPTYEVKSALINGDYLNFVAMRYVS